MLENIRLSFQGIWSHKMRSFLTMLGVIIGIASIIAIVSTIKGTNEQIKQNLIGAGNNNVTITLNQGDGEYWMDSGTPEGVIPLSDDIKEGIRALDHVENASFFNSRTYVDGISNGDTRLDSGKAYGIDQQYLDTCRNQQQQEAAKMEEQDNIIELIDDETGAPIRFQHLATIEHEGELYIALSEADAPEDGQCEVFIMQVAQEEDGTESYIQVEDEAVQQAVFDKFLQLVNEGSGDDE